MLDIKWIRENPDALRDLLAKRRNNSIDVDAFRLRAKGNQTIQITRTQSSDADVTLSVFDDQGQQLGGCFEPDRCIITVFGLGPTDIVPLVVVVAPSQTPGRYALDVISVP